MRKETDIFAEDFEIPDIVKQKMNDAFATIKTEGNMSKNRIRMFRNPAAAIACICILAVGSITAYAACNYFWSRGMKGTLQATDMQQQMLVENDVATKFSEAEDYTSMAVTNEGVTVIPEMMVVNDKMVYLSLTVEGYDLPEGQEPCFEFVDVYLGEDPDAEEGWLNMGASFYNGIISAEDGTNIYEDGTELIIDEQGKLEEHYVDENGKMEYVIIAMVSEPEKSLLGESLQVELTNLGTVYKTNFTDDIEAEWNYTFQLSDTSLTERVQIGDEVEGTMFSLESMEISPVSIKLNYNVTGEINSYEDVNRIPDFCGVVLKDGTRLPYLSTDGMSGFTDSTLCKAFEISAFERVIDTEQVSAILLQTKEGMVEIAID